MGFDSGGISPNSGSIFYPGTIGVEVTPVGNTEISSMVGYIETPRFWNTNLHNLIYTYGGGSKFQYSYTINPFSGATMIDHQYFYKSNNPTMGGWDDVSSYYGVYKARGHIEDVLLSPESNPYRTIIVITDAGVRMITQNVLLNWEETLTSVRALYSPNEYYIVGWSWGGLTFDLVKRLSFAALIEDSEFGNYGRPDLDIINEGFKGSSFGGSSGIQTFDAKTLGYTYEWLTKQYSHLLPSGKAYSGEYLDIIQHLIIENNTLIEAYSPAHGNGWKIELPNKITVHLIKKEYSDEAVTYVNEEPIDPVPDPVIIDSSKGSSTASDKGSLVSGFNGISSGQDYNYFQYDSTYISPADYSNFVAGEGGIIAESGIYPVGEASDYDPGVLPTGVALYIENIKLSVSGSNMVVKQVNKFDDTALFAKGDRVYGYLIKQDGDKQPSFAGFINSISRQLTNSGQEIIYTCLDLKGYLNQFITPIIYRQEKSIKDIATEILFKTGIALFSNNLPDIIAPVDFNADTLPYVLDHLCSIAGDYYYWIDKNGYLIIDQLNQFSHSYSVPSEGDALLSTNYVQGFDSLVDLSNSRSRILVIGSTGESVINSIFTEKLTRTISPIRPTDVPTITSDFSQMEDQNSWFLIQKSSLPGSTIYKAYLAVSVGTPYEILSTGAYVENYETGAIMGSIVHQSTRTLIFSMGEITKSSTGLLSGNVVSGSGTLIYIAHAYYKIIAIDSNSTVGEGLMSISYNTGYTGGIYVYKNVNLESTPANKDAIKTVMSEIAYRLSLYYRPIYGGRLFLDDLQTDLKLGDMLSLTNTSLPSDEASNLKIYEIEYDISTKSTTVVLSSKLTPLTPALDPEVLRAQSSLAMRTWIANNSITIRNIATK